MTDRYHRMMRNAAYILFGWAVVVFVLTLIAAVLQTFVPDQSFGGTTISGGGLPMLVAQIGQAFHSAAYPFFGAAILYRLDLWLERKQ